MHLVFKKLFLIIIITLIIVSQSWATTTRIVPTQDLTYAGVFKMPSAGATYSYAHWDDGGYHSQGITFGPGGKLYVPGITYSGITISQQDFHIVDITIPGTLSPLRTTYSSVVSGTLGTWQDAGSWITWPTTILPSPPTSGQPTNQTVLGGIDYLPAKGTQGAGKFYFGLYCGYCINNLQALKMFPHCPLCSPGYGLLDGLIWWVNSDFTTNFAGPWLMTDDVTLRFANIISHLPDSWATTYTSGRSLIVGGHRYGQGLTLRAIAPWDSCTTNCDTDPPAPGSTLPYTTLLEYDTSHGMGVAGSVDSFTSVAWITINSKSTLVIYGLLSSRLGNDNTHDWWTQYDSNYPDLYLKGSMFVSGYIDPIPRPVLLFFDTSDLATVTSGGPAYVPQPYAVMDLTPYFYHNTWISWSSYPQAGIAYDASGQKLYIREYSNEAHVVHVFDISDTATDNDTTGPSAPILTQGATTRTSVSLSWTASSDSGNSSLVTYHLYRNGFPIYYTDDLTGRSHTDNALSYYISPVEYYVLAVDAAGNQTQSNIVRIDDSNQGNAPINIFTNSLTEGGSMHESVGVPAYNPTQSYSFTPVSKGGSGGNVWSISGWPTGFSINSSTGEITASAGLANAYRSNMLITVIDSAGNRCDKLAKIYAQATDRDFDGWTATQETTAGTDDGNANSNPSNPIQPVPTGLVATPSTSSVILTWTEPTFRSYVRSGYTSAKYLGDYSYTVYHGTSPGVYPDSKYIGRGVQTPSNLGKQTYIGILPTPNAGISYTWTGLSTGTHYFVIKAVDFIGLESTNSSEVSAIIGSPGVTYNGQAYGAYYAEGLDQTASIVQTTDGLVIVGPTWSYSWTSGPGTETARIMMIKINTSGVEQWRKIIGPEGYNITTKVRSSLSWIPTKVILSGTDIVICGYKSTSDTQGVDAFLMKFDSSGTLIWDRTFNNVTYPTKDDYLTGVVERSGGFAACGYGWTGVSYGYGFWLLLTDADGLNPVSTYSTYLSKGWAAASTIRKTADNGFLVAGMTSSGTDDDADYYAIKYNSSGVSQWINRFDNSSRKDKAFGVEEDASGNFWIFGRSQLLGYENTNIWIVKTDSHLTQLATYTIGDAVAGNAYIARGSVKLANGNFLIVGYTNISSASGYHGYVAEINKTTGATVQSATIGATTGATEEYLFKGVQSSDNTYLHVIGTDNGSFTTAYDFWYLKLLASTLAVQNHTTCTSKTTYYYDKDLDGLGNNNQWTTPTGDCCFAMPGYVLGHTDQDDSISGTLGIAIGVQGVGVEMR